MVGTCMHMAHLQPLVEKARVCEDCVKIGARWLHLRQCRICGHVGCCDSSPNRHATAHFATTGHAVIQSFEPGEDWVWCYVDEVFAEEG